MEILILLLVSLLVFMSFVTGGSRNKLSKTKDNRIFHVGQKVWHKQRPDCGEGIIIAITNGIADVKFSQSSFSGIPIESVTREKPIKLSSNKTTKVQSAKATIVKKLHHEDSVSPITSAKKFRTTYCHRCKTNLSSRVNMECLSCGWLVCPKCGACEFNCKKIHH